MGERQALQDPRGDDGEVPALRLAAGALLLCLALAAPAGASELSFAGGSYRWVGTEAAGFGEPTEELYVRTVDAPLGRAFLFEDVSYRIDAGAGLPTDCATLSAHEIRCYTAPASITIDGVDGGNRLGVLPADVAAWPAAVGLELLGGPAGDLLGGAGGDDTLVSGGADDLLRPGLGADRVDGGGSCDGCTVGDILEFREARTAGVDVDLGAGTGPDAGDTVEGIENVRGTDLADTIAGDPRVENEIAGRGGDDRIDVAGPGRDIDDAECGSGEDSAAGDEWDDVATCDLAIDAAGSPLAGFVRLGVRPYYRGDRGSRLLDLADFARCTVAAGCELEFGVRGLQRASVRLDAGRTCKCRFRLSRRAEAELRAQEKGTRRVVFLTLTAEGAGTVELIHSEKVPRPR